ncbi:MAG: aspartate--tRNA(Asn) ligase [Candidatus Hydrothermarchaeota archaeon]
MKRSHYASEVRPELSESNVSVTGWVHEIRDLGGIKFIVLRDRSGFIQITAPKQRIDSKIFEKIDELHREDLIGVEGKVRAFEKAPQGVEIIPEKIEIISRSDTQLPLDPTGKVSADIDTRLNARVMDLRRIETQAIFKIRDETLDTIRRFLRKEGFLEVNTPKIVASATEGGTELFPISYFEREAFLVQSPQLYKQMLMATGFDKVFEIGPIFRAEEHSTRRHLNEITSVDIEAAFSDYKDVMDLLKNLLIEIFKEIKKRCGDELDTLNRDLNIPKKFETLTYSEVIDILSSHVEVHWGEDLSTPALKKLSEFYEEPYFIIDWPTQTKPFYAKQKENKELTETFDLMLGEIELASGATRVHEVDQLIERIKSQGLNPESFKYYLDAFRYGMPPHAGWGLGLERLLMSICGLKNIREAVLFPRDRQRLIP